MIELIPAKDVNTKHTKYGMYANPGKQTKRRIVNKLEYRVRNKNRCFFCGHLEGQWIQAIVKGRPTYHFICNECRQNRKFVII